MEAQDLISEISLLGPCQPELSSQSCPAPDLGSPVLLLSLGAGIISPEAWRQSRTARSPATSSILTYKPAGLRLYGNLRRF
jgi:hypothetical protein